MKNKAKVIFSEEAEKAYMLLRDNSDSKLDGMILKAIDKKAELIKINTHYGEPVAKNLIPKEYILKYNVTNLFRIELPAFWRMLYTLKNDEKEIEIIAFVMDVINHKEYNKKFNYKNN